MKFFAAAFTNSPYGSTFLWSIGVISALLTSFYMFRLIFLTFFGTARYDEHETHVHESPGNMLAPLVILAVLSIIGGWLAAPALWGGVDHFEHFLDPVFLTAASVTEQAPAAKAAETASLEFMLMFVAIGAAIIGLYLAWRIYIQRPGMSEKLAESLKVPHRVLTGKYFVDEIYAALFVRPLVWISRNVLWHVGGRTNHRWHREWRGRRFAPHGRHGAPNGVRQHAQLRRMDCGGRDCFYFPAVVAGGEMT